MAPEAWSVHNYGSIVDMYSIRIVMCGFLNQNRSPFLPDAPNPITLGDRDDAQRMRFQGMPIPNIKGISSKLNTILLKACDFDPSRRYASPTEMQEALEALSVEKQYAPVSTPVQSFISLYKMRFE